MLNLNKHSDFFDPHTVKSPIHIIGVGAIGSTVLNQLVRLGFDNIHIYDFDRVSDHNLANQMFFQNDIGNLKTDAMGQMATRINPSIKLHHHLEGWKKGTKLDGHVIIAVDSTELRKEIVEDNLENFELLSLLDMRMGLEEGQMYFADATSAKDIKLMLNTMQFKDDEVVSVVSACGTTLSVLPTIQMIVSIGVMNLLNFIKTGEYNHTSFVDSIAGKAISYKY